MSRLVQNDIVYTRVVCVETKVLSNDSKKTSANNNRNKIASNLWGAIWKKADMPAEWNIKNIMTDKGI